MPFPMTHIRIAKRITEIYPETVKNLPQFYLGTLAPDSVHFRPNAITEDKKATHFLNENDKWGETTNNSGWLDNVLSFFNAYRQSDNYDFIYGYCAHIIADIYNNIHVWTPFRLKHPDELKKGYGNIHHTENGKVDLQLAQNYVYRDEIWSLLEKSHSPTIPDIVFADDIDKIKSNVLYVQYKNESIIDTSANTFVTYDNAITLIENTAPFVIEKLFK